MSPVQRRGLREGRIARAQLLKPRLEALSAITGAGEDLLDRIVVRISHYRVLAFAFGVAVAAGVSSGPEPAELRRRARSVWREDACRQRLEQNRASARTPWGIGPPHHVHFSGGLGGGEAGRSRSRSREAASRQRFEQ
jgi:hypothetical protein